MSAPFIVAISCKVSNTTNTCSNKNCHTVKQSHCHCETVYDQLTPLTEYGEWLENWLISSPMSLEAQLSSLSLFSDTVRLTCAFAPLFMVHFQYCFLSIYKIHIIIVCSTSLMASLIRSVGGLSKCFYQGLWLAVLSADVIGQSINRRGVA